VSRGSTSAQSAGLRASRGWTGAHRRQQDASGVQVAEKERHQIRNGVIATVVGGALLTLWPSFRDWFADLLAWLLALLEASLGWAASTHAVYGWVLVGSVLLAAPTVVSALIRLFSKTEAAHINGYTHDSLFGADWTWRYINEAIIGLWCLCPDCKSELVYSETLPPPFKVGIEARTDFDCERCQVTRVSLAGRKDFAIGTVTREIRRKIRTGEWTPAHTNG
jgi:hypothetical protein